MPKKAHKAARRADDGDAETGRRIRARRLEQCMSQTDLADRCGVTFQQIQKYEKGVNRVGSSRLAKIAAALDVLPGYFFPENGKDGEHGKADVSHMFELAQDRGAIRILEAYSKCNRAKRTALVETAEAMAA